MTLLIRIGRRTPKVWAKRMFQKMAGLVSFQENIWIIVKQSLNLAKKKAKQVGGIIFTINTERETEDINTDIEWVVVTVQGTKEQEQEEHEQSMKLYSNISNHFKKEFPKSAEMAKMFKTKMLPMKQVEEAYEKGYGCMGDRNIASKLLEMGIMTHIEWIHDYENRNYKT